MDFYTTAAAAFMGTLAAIGFLHCVRTFDRTDAMTTPWWVYLGLLGGVAFVFIALLSAG